MTSTTILALDPGPEVTGYALVRTGEELLFPLEFGIEKNGTILSELKSRSLIGDVVAIEMIASYGMPVGREVFETCLWIGRFIETAGSECCRLVYRKDVKSHLCGSPRAKDANIRQALLDLHPRTGGGAVPQVGTKGKPGPLYGISSHAWAALAVAHTCHAGISEVVKP